jgi:hypothetical protein
MRSRAWLTILALVLLPALSAPGGLVQPGQSVSLLASDVPTPGGTLLEKKTSAFAIDYGEPAKPFSFSGKLTGTLRSAVYSDRGHLTFVYDIDLNGQPGISGAAEASRLSVGSFRSFKTSVFGAMDFEELVRGSRSRDGSQVWLDGTSPGMGGPPRMIVRTDATAYDANGKASFYAADEVPTLSGARLAAGGVNFTGIFRPVMEVAAPSPPPLPPTSSGGPSAGSGSGTGVPSAPSPTPIPLPPAAYSAIGVLLAMGLIALTRRGWRMPS